MGKLVSTTGTLASTVGVKNPYRYRGYRYDTETGLYYLQSRYYNAEWSRFINADALGGTVGKLLSHNIFSYCDNNPVNCEDPSGHLSFANFFIKVLQIAVMIIAVISSKISQMSNSAINGAQKFVSKVANKPISNAVNKGAAKAVNRTIPEIVDSQVGKKLIDHAPDYGLTKSREGAMAYKEITQDVLKNATEIRTGNWKTLGESEFWIYGDNVSIVNNGKWVSTFPISKPGTVKYINSLPIKK